MRLPGTWGQIRADHGAHPHRDAVAAGAAPHRRCGFTLFESLVAVALFGLAASILLMAVGNLARGLHESGPVSETAFLREFVVRSVQSLPTRDAVLRGGEVRAPDGRKIPWSAELAQAETADLHQLTLRFASGQSNETVREGGAAETTVSLLLFKPEWSDPVLRAERIATVRSNLGLAGVGGSR